MWIGVAPAKLLAGPEICLIAAPEVVVLRSLNRVIFIREVIEREAPANRLLIERIRRAGQRVRLPGLRLTLGADDVLDVGEFQQIAQFGSVEDVGRVDDGLVAAEHIFQRDRQHLVAVGLRADGLVVQEDAQMPAGTIGREHGFHDRQ